MSNKQSKGQAFVAAKPNTAASAPATQEPVNQTSAEQGKGDAVTITNSDVGDLNQVLGGETAGQGTTEDQTDTEQPEQAPVVQQEAPAPAQPPAPAPSLAPVGLSNASLTSVEVQAPSIEELGLSFAWSTDTLEYLKRVKASGNNRAFDALFEVDRFCTHCARTHILSEDEIAKATVRLLRAIVGVVEYGGEEFSLAFATLLLMFHENGGDAAKFGALSDYLIYRGQAAWTGTDDEQKAFNQLIPALRVIAPAQGRDEAVRLLNINKALELVFSEGGRARVRSFLNV